MYKRCALALGALLLACAGSLADWPDTEGTQVPVPAACRVANPSGLRCAWCAVETLARYHGVTAASSLPGGKADGGEVLRALDALSVRYVARPAGPKDERMLEEACGLGRGAAVGLGGTHVVVVVHFRGNVVKVIDSSDPGLGVRSWTREHFLERWDGWAVSLVPPG